MIRNIDETLSDNLLIDNIMGEFEIEYGADRPHINKNKWENISSEEMGDPKNNAFPCNTRARCFAAIGYLTKYFNNPSMGGVTAGYSEEDFKEVHNCVVSILENKYNIKHDGCAICGKSRKEAASMGETNVEETNVVSNEPTEPEAPVVEEPTVADAPVSEAAPEVESPAAEPVEPASDLVILEASLAEKDERINALELEIASKEGEIVTIKRLHSRLAALGSDGIGVSGELEPIIGKLTDEEFGVLHTVLKATQKQESVEETPVEASVEEATEEVEEPAEPPAEPGAEASETEPEIEPESAESAEASIAGIGVLNLEDAIKSKNDMYRSLMRS
jgi:hypothetical protein